MKLLYCSRAYSTHDRRFLEALSGAGCAVHFLPMLHDRLDSRDLPPEVTRVPWRNARGNRGFLSLPWNCFRLRRTLTSLRPEVVLAGPLQGAALLVALTGYRPLISVSWGSDLLVDADRSPWMRALAGLALRRSAGALGDCAAVRRKIREYSSLCDDDIVTFPWGVELNRFHAAPSSVRWREELAWQDNPVLISVRSWEPIYAIDVLLRAFDQARRRRPRIKLLLLGDGSQAPLIRRLLHDLKLEGAVHVPGRIPQEALPDYYRIADLYVSSARSDGSSVSLLEAMACGLPVITTHGPGNAEWVQDGVNGWLADASDPFSLATAMETALASPEKWPAFRQANLTSIRERADWSRNFPKLMPLLQRAACSASAMGTSRTPKRFVSNVA